LARLWSTSPNKAHHRRVDLVLPPASNKVKK
jgi:hypothetical protein